VSETAGSADTIRVVSADRRVIAACQWGDLEGNPVFWLHGTPGCRLLRHPGTSYADRHLRVVTLDRPGYGLSSRRPGRRVADAAEDVATVAQALGIARYAVAGASGGAPVALAAAAVYPERVTRCATVVGCAPFDAEGLDFFAGMDGEARAGWERSLEGEQGVLEDYAELLDWLDAGLPGLDLPPESADMLGSMTREALRPGPGGYIDDYLSLVRDWGFSLSAVQAPTRIMAAREDTSVPPSHSEWLGERIDTAEVIWVPNGHLGPREEEELELFTWLGAGN